MSSQSSRPEYYVSVRTNDVNEAIASVANTLYALIEEAMAAHESHEAEECEFETFARDVIGVLSRHADRLSGDHVSWGDEEGTSDSQYE